MVGQAMHEEKNTFSEIVWYLLGDNRPEIKSGSFLEIDFSFFLENIRLVLSGR